jgi:hypothetical protein
MGDEVAGQMGEHVVDEFGLFAGTVVGGVDGDREGIFKISRNDATGDTRLWHGLYDWLLL